MQNPERLIALIKTICEENWSKVYYDLFLTDKRMVLIHQKPKLDSNYSTVGAAVGLAGGMVGATVGAVLGAMVKDIRDSKKNKAQEAENAPTLNELLKADKKNCAIRYEDLEWFKLNKSRSEYCSIVFKIGKKTRTFYLMRERAEELGNALPNIVALNGKLVK